MEWHDRSHTLVKRHVAACLQFAEKALSSQIERREIFWSDETKIELCGVKAGSPSLSLVERLF